MSERLIIDLRRPLRDFVAALSPLVGKIPEYVLEETVNFIFDILIYELEDCCEDPDLSRLGNFYRDHIEPDPRLQRLFLDSFSDMLRDITSQLRAHGFYTGDGFEYRPERRNKNRSIVVKRFDTSY